MFENGAFQNVKKWKQHVHVKFVIKKIISVLFVACELLLERP